MSHGVLRISGLRPPRRKGWCALLISLLLLLATTSAYAQFTPADQAAIFKAAGFTRLSNGEYVGCTGFPKDMTHQAGQIEAADLNGDGLPEAWVTESNGFCHGSQGDYFVLVTKDASGWRKLIAADGMQIVRKTKRNGWPDIEVGGPGLGKFPVLHWNGKTYQ